MRSQWRRAGSRMPPGPAERVWSKLSRSVSRSARAAAWPTGGLRRYRHSAKRPAPAVSVAASAGRIGKARGRRDMVVPFEAPTAQAVPGSAAAVAPLAEKTVRRRAEEEEPRLAHHPRLPLFDAFVILARVPPCVRATDRAEGAGAGKPQ